MSRWKPPAPKASPYITPDGYRRLQEAFANLWQHRGEVTIALSAAAAEGDRSENAEYIYRKKELREIDSRIRYLQTRIPLLKIVSEVQDTSRIFFGAKVKLVDEQGKATHVHLVGADELIMHQGNISIDSPLARALLSKSIHDQVHYTVMERTIFFVVAEISYDPSSIPSSRDNCAQLIPG